MANFFIKNFRWIAGGFLLTFLSSFGQTFFISASIAEWQNNFSLSHGGFGRLYMLATLMSALTLPFLGRLVDIWPEHKVIMLVAPMLGLACIMAAYAPSIPVLIFAIYILRLFGQGMMTHIALTATGRWFAGHRGRVISLVVLGHQAGEALLPITFAAITVWLGYQWGWITGALILVLIGLPFGVWAYKKPRIPRQDIDDRSETAGYDGRHWTRAQVLRDPLFYILLMGTLAPAFIGTTIFFHQDYLTTLRQWPAATFASGMSVMAFTTIIFALLNGVLIDRFGARKILPFFLFPLALSCFALSQGASVYIFMILLGISYGFSSTLFGALWPETYGTKNLGAVRAIIVSAMVFATSAGPGITGTLIDQGFDLPKQMLMMGLYCIIVCFLMAFAAIRLGKRQTKS